MMFVTNKLFTTRIIQSILIAHDYKNEKYLNNEEKDKIYYNL